MDRRRPPLYRRVQYIILLLCTVTRNRSDEQSMSGWDLQLLWTVFFRLLKSIFQFLMWKIKRFNFFKMWVLLMCWPGPPTRQGRLESPVWNGRLGSIQIFHILFMFTFSSSSERGYDVADWRTARWMLCHCRRHQLLGSTTNKCFWSMQGDPPQLEDRYRFGSETSWGCGS